MSILATGSRVLVYIDGNPYGRAISLQFTSETGVRDIETIDSQMPAELASTRCKIKGQVTYYRAPGDGDIQGMGIVAPFHQISRQKYFSIQLKDRLTGKTLFKADYCKVNSQSGSVSAKGIWAGSFSFTGITWGNETSAVAS